MLRHAGVSEHILCGAEWYSALRYYNLMRLAIIGKGNDPIS
jgi:hypothetical protein